MAHATSARRCRSTFSSRGCSSWKQRGSSGGSSTSSSWRRTDTRQQQQCSCAPAARRQHCSAAAVRPRWQQQQPQVQACRHRWWRDAVWTRAQPQRPDACFVVFLGGLLTPAPPACALYAAIASLLLVPLFLGCVCCLSIMGVWFSVRCSTTVPCCDDSCRVPVACPGLPAVLGCNTLYCYLKA